MTPFIPLLTIYALITIGSASILYFSFKGQVDTSGRYFLFGELSMLPVLLQVIILNLYPQLSGNTIFFIGNFFYIASEIATLFSIYTLTNNVRTNQYWLAIFCGAIYCIFIEFCRSFVDPKLPFLLNPLSSIAFALATYMACKKSRNLELQSSLFLKWFRFLEIGLAAVSMVRAGSYFTNIPISPREPATVTIFVFTVFATLNIFRYIAYQSIRISWIDPRSGAANPLNKNLAKVVDEKNQLLEGLISSNRVIGISALASSLAHQLSQPLTGINMQVEMLKRNIFKPEHQDLSVNLLNEMGKELEGLSDLVKNLRLLFGSRNSKPEPIDLTQTSDAILEIIEPTLKTNQIALHKIYHGQPFVMGDAIQLQQVLINIFNNAIQAINSANLDMRKIHFEISEMNGFAILTIMDSGPGIAQGAVTSIFELYKTTKKDGLGVGLWLSKTIIEKHRGSIKARNTENGALFEIRIPLAEINKSETP